MRYLLAKIFFAYILITLLLAGIIYSFGIDIIKNYFINYYSNNVISIIENNINNNNNEIYHLDSIKVVLNNLNKIYNYNYTLVDIGLNALFTVDTNINPILNKFITKEYSLKDENINKFTIFNQSNRIEQLVIFYSLKIKGFDGYLVAIKNLDELSNLNNELGKIIRNVTLIVILISIILILLYIWYLSNPIKELIISSRRVAEGLFDTKVFLPKRHELKELADNYNNMLTQLKYSFDLVKNQKLELEFILNSIQDIFVVIDFNGKIILNSRSLNLLTNTENTNEKYLWELIRADDFHDFFELVKRTQNYQFKELVINGKTFLCSATVLHSKSEIIIIMQDISDIRKFEVIKREFVSNVSHELRTPLTSIKGFIETLIENSDEENKYYLEIVLRNTNRLILIVKDLLLLSNLENNSSNLEINLIDFNKIKDSILINFEEKLKQKQLNLHFNIADNLTEYYGDEFKIEQVFINLIDNAIKYTDNGEINVRIFNNDKCLIIEVEDTGLGIPEIHHSRLFERFYTVDKSRSRKLGGTGLGLSIVKHIITLHYGEINLEKNRKVGTKFIISLPINNK